MGWKWKMKETSTDWWTRSLLPPDQIGQYTTIWGGRKCDYVDTAVVSYFNPSIYPSAALQVKACMEEVHEFNCDIQYHTSWDTPWLVMFRQQQDFLVDGSGQTMQEAIVKAVLRDSIKEILEQMWV